MLTQEGIDHFVDVEFPPIMASIYDPENEQYPFDEEIIWKRVADFLNPTDRPTPAIYRDTILPTDVVEGKLGDGWLTSALACLVEHPHLLHKLFITQNYDHKGVYKVQLCKGGIWQEITLDDYFPCSTVSGGLAMFSRSATTDMWVLLLEKAFAKVHGNYFSLRGGMVSEALADLTGCPTEVVRLDEEDAQADIQSGALFQKVERSLREGFIVAASTEGEELWAEIEDYQLPTGLLKAHAYCVVEARTTASFQRLFKVRNVW